MYGEKPRVTYRKETRDAAIASGRGLFTLDADLRHLDGPAANRMTIQAQGDPGRIRDLFGAAFGAFMVDDTDWRRQEGSYERER